jgi:osmotically-inducible protein OsmY
MRERERKVRDHLGQDSPNTFRAGEYYNWKEHQEYPNQSASRYSSSRSYSYGDRDSMPRQIGTSRSQSSRDNPYGNEYYRSANRNRDWSDRTSDEVRSWFGDEEARQRRRLDDRRGNEQDHDDQDHERYYRSRYPSRSPSNDYIPATRDNFEGHRPTTYDRYTRFNPGPGTNPYAYSRYGSRSRYDRERYQDWNREDDRGFTDKAGDEVRSWFGDEEAERRRRMDNYYKYTEDRNRDRQQNRYDQDRQRITYPERRRGLDW